MKSKSLSSIDQTLIDAGYFLEDFKDEQKLNCLSVFVECVDVIGWIRTYTKGTAKNMSTVVFDIDILVILPGIIPLPNVLYTRIYMHIMLL